MMQEEMGRRKSLRAPLFVPILLAPQGEHCVASSTTLNISEGGLLLKYLPLIPEKSFLDCLLVIPHLPVFTGSLQEWANLLVFYEQGYCLRANISLRHHQEMNPEEMLFQQVGVEFTGLSRTALGAIERYTQQLLLVLTALQKEIEDSYHSPLLLEIAKPIMFFLEGSTPASLKELRERAGALYKAITLL